MFHSLYLKPERGMLVLGRQRDGPVDCAVDLAGLRRALPPGVTFRDPLTGEDCTGADGTVRLTLPGRGWRLVEARD